MPFPADPVRQSKPFTLTGQTSPLSLSFDNPVLAGSTIIITGTAISSTDVAAILGTPSGAGTHERTDNTRSAGAGSPNVCGAVLRNVSAGSPTLSVPFTFTSGTTFRFSGVMMEVEGAATAATVVDTTASPRTGTASATTSTTPSAATGLLAQADSFIIVSGGGWGGQWGTPTDFVSRLAQQNGPLIGASVSTRKVSATTSLQPSVPHESGGATSVLLYVLKGSVAAALMVEYEFPASGDDSMPASDNGLLEAIQWRNVEPYSSSGGTAGYTYHSGSQIVVQSGTKPGDSTTRLVQIVGGLPSGLVIGDTMRAQFRKTGGVTNGNPAVLPGTVKTV